MSKLDEPLEGEVLPPVTATPALDAFGALSTIVDATAAYLKLREEQRTKRATIDAYKKRETERIKSAESVLKAYFEHVFAERAHTITELFTRLDEATARGDDAVVAGTLTAIVDVARSSPLAAAGDLGQLRKALDDPDHVWEL